MAEGKIRPLLGAEAQRADAAIDDAVNEPANANERITAGCLDAVDVYNAHPVPPVPPENASPPENAAYWKAAIARLEETVKALCRAQMTLPRSRDFRA